MKKLYSIFLMGLMALTSAAQVVLVDPEGAVEYTDGETLVIYPTEQEGMYLFHSPKIRNKSAKEVKVVVSYNVTFPAGIFMDCLSGSCIARQAPGVYSTSEFALKAGETKETQTEWNFNYWDDDEGDWGYYEGTCTGVFTIKVDGLIGNTITVKYVNNIADGIKNITMKDNANTRAAYDLQGRRMTATPVKGLFVKGGKKYIR